MEIKLARGHFCERPVRSCGISGFVLTEARYPPNHKLPRHNLKFLDDVTVSRFALIAGEGARVPSTNRLVPVQIEFWAKPVRPAISDLIIHVRHSFSRPVVMKNASLAHLLLLHDRRNS
jgi:hypothetical protein